MWIREQSSTYYMVEKNLVDPFSHFKVETIPPLLLSSLQSVKIKDSTQGTFPLFSPNPCISRIERMIKNINLGLFSLVNCR